MAVYPDIEVGDLVTADLLTSMLPKTYVKAASLGRQSTITPVADNELQNIPLDPGTYEIDFAGNWSQATSVAQGITTQWAFTGTANTPQKIIIGQGVGDTTAATVATTVNIRAAITTGAVVYNQSGTGLSSIREIVRNFTVTVAGNLSFNWSQASSQASDTNLAAGSGFKITRVG